MEKIKKRINVDYHLRWPISVTGAITSLSDLDLTLEAVNTIAGKFLLPFEVVGDAVEFDFPASKQTSLGSYAFTLYANYGKVGQAALDVVDNLQLVRWTKDESVPTETNLNLDQMITLEGNVILVGVKGEKGDKGDTIPAVDSLDSDSAVDALSARQGKVLKELVDGKQDAIEDLEDIRSGAGKGATALQPSDVAKVAKTGSYNDLTDKPGIPDVSGKADKTYVDAELAKKANSSSVPTKVSQLANDSGYLTQHQDISGKADVSYVDEKLGDKADKTYVDAELKKKQDSIADLSTIRTGAGKGATALQPSDVKAVAKTGSYNDLTDKPSIPDASGKADKSYVDAELAKKNVKIKPGENVTITDNADGTQTVSARGGSDTPVVDNLESTSTTSALSANQGRVLKKLVDDSLTSRDAEGEGAPSMEYVAEAPKDGEQYARKDGAWSKVDGKQAFLPITYAELKALRDAGGLTAGMQYRITDYECTTIQEDTRSAGHQFDIIVTADSESVLNENARAIQHEGDTYFSDCNLAAWELKYSLDNDVDRFAWSASPAYFFVDDDWKYVRYPQADTDGKFAWAYEDNGSLDTGDIMFTNTDNPTNGEYAEQEGSEYEIYGYYAPTTPTNFKGVVWYMKDEYGNECYYDFKNIQFKKSSFVYTFGGDRDATINGICHHNSLSYSSRLPNNTFGDSCYNNTFGNDCYDNTFGSDCCNNTFGSGCHDNTFGNGCSSNTFGNSCYNNTFGSGSYNNTIENYYVSNTFGNSCYNNTFGISCNNNTFGNYCCNNTFGNYCISNTFGNNCNSNTFGNDCTYNNFGSSSSVKINYCRNISLGDGVYNNKISGTTTPTSSKYLQNIRIAQGVSGQTILVATGLAYETYVGFGSNGALVMKNNLDQYTKPSTGIPSTDLAQSVRNTLAKVEEIYQDYIDANNLI